MLAASYIFVNSRSPVTLMQQLEGLENGVIVRDCFEVGQKMSTYCRELLKIVSPNFEVVVDLATDGCGEVCGRGGLGVHRGRVSRHERPEGRTGGAADLLEQ